MGSVCEHEEGSPMGSCAICGEMICSECFRTVFNQNICGGHEELEEESSWELVGFYTSEASLKERRFYLEEQDLTSISVETDEESIELYVPESQRVEAYEALVSSGEETFFCGSCLVQYASELRVCPMCGVRQQD